MVLVLSLIVYAIFGILIVQIICEGFNFHFKHPLYQAIICKKNAHSVSDQLNKKDLYQVFFYALFYRMFIYAISAIAIRIFMNDSEPFNLVKLFTNWEQWDAKHYIGIARDGYSGYIEAGKPIFLVFFPLYSWVIRCIYKIIPCYEICAILVSVLCYCFGCCYLYALTANEFGKSVAKKAVIYLSVFPFSFYFGGMMTESIFFLTSVACLYHIRKHNWGRMMIWGAFCSLSRMHGLLLCVAGAVELVNVYQPFSLLKQKKYKEFWHFLYSKASYLFGIPIGTIIYLWVNYSVAGDPFIFTKFQKEHWSQGSTWFTNTLTYVIENTFSSSHGGMLRASIWIPEFCLFLIGLVTIIYALKRHHNTFVSYSFLYLMLNYSLTWLISGGRYMSCCIPMFIVWAEFADRHENVDRIITIACSALLGIYLTGFLFSKQIM